MKLFIINILVFFLFGFQVQSQIVEDKNLPVQEVNIPKEHIEDYKNNPDFDYAQKTKKDSVIAKFINWLKRIAYKILYKIFSWLFGIKFAPKAVMAVIKALPYVAVVFFVYLIFRYLLGIDLIRMKKRGNAKMPQVKFSDDERIIREENIDELIKKAVKDNDYRLAVRYYYLKTLKLLMQKELIDWKPEKTNRDYTKELTSTAFADSFRKLTFVYDFVWYGKFSPSKNDFSEIKTDFEKIFSKNLM